MKEAGGAGPVRIPTAPDSFAVMLIPNNQLLERGKVELKISASPKCFDGFDEDKISRARTKTRRVRRRQDEKFAGLEMSGLLQANLGEMGGRVSSPFRHLRDLFQDEIVQVGRFNDSRALQDNAADENPDQLQHAGPLATNVWQATGDIGFRQRIC